jgi:hypothetical protein
VIDGADGIRFLRWCEALERHLTSLRADGCKLQQLCFDHEDEGTKNSRRRNVLRAFVVNVMT